ncbi:MAG TPA: hypothetical protein VJ876_05175 [Bacteroidales bacterium]|nr:hypothetical protein [Bacteroidales bacterium]
MLRKRLTLIILMTTAGLFVFGQSRQASYSELRELYLDQKHEECYRLAEPSEATGALFRALSLYRLPDEHPLKKQHDAPLLTTMELLREARGNLGEKILADTSWLMPEIKAIQQTAFRKAENWYRGFAQNRAERYFNAMHRTFNNASSLFHNYYGFNGAHFLEILQSNQIQEEGNEKYYRREMRKLIDQHYRNKEAFQEWNNPVYRLANTAAEKNYLKKEEKMIYYYLNLARMNPALFRETFIDARLRVKYHGEIQVTIPVYDTLTVEDYNATLSQQEFFDLPVHKIYEDEMPQREFRRFVSKKMINKTSRGERYRFDINYSGLYRHLMENRPGLLKLKNLDKFSINEENRGQILFKLYDEKYTYYNRTYKEETENNYYYLSLFKKLNKMQPLNILHPEKQLFRTAECWAVEAGQRGLKGHDRITCRTDYHGEACDYGNSNGFDVILSLLVDKYVPSLGHRKILLGRFSLMGAAIRPHNSELDYNAVLDFKR